MLDLSPSLAEALVERDLGRALVRSFCDCTPAANFQGNPEKTPIRRSVWRQEIQLTIPGFTSVPNVVRPERRVWVPKKREPVRGKKAPYKKPTEFCASYSEIARQFTAAGEPITAEGIRMIEKRALRKCREACERFGITPDVLLESWVGK